MKSTFARVVGLSALALGCTATLNSSGTGGTTGATGGTTGAIDGTITGGTTGAGLNLGTGGSVATGGALGTGGVSTGGSVGTGGAGTGGGPGTGGASTGASHCGARPGMVFCDDFENDSAGAPPAPWTTTGSTSTSMVTIDGTNPAESGTKSVHIQDGDSDYDTFLQFHDTSVLPVPGGKLYLRYYIRLAQPMTMGHNTLVRGDLYATQGQGNNLLFGEDNQMLYLSINGDGMAEMSNNNYYTDHQIGAGYPAGIWTCVELLLDHNTPEINVWVNGTEVPDLNTTKWGVDAYDYLRFGFEKYAGPASEMWYDDIAIGTQPIGCN